MLKRLTLLGLAIVASAALVAPTAAGAATVLQGGELLPTGTVLTGVSTNWEFTSELGTLACSNATVAGTLTENDGTVKVAGNEAGNSVTGCSVGGNPLTITGFRITSLESTSTESNTGHMGLVFVASLFGVECYYESAGPAGVFEYSEGGSSIALEPTHLSGPCGGVTLHATFALTAGGSPVELL